METEIMKFKSIMSLILFIAVLSFQPLFAEDDQAKMFEQYHKAAEQGDAKAQFNLGWCYSKGEGVAKDTKTAVAWYRKAAEQGDMAAQYALGACYFCGEGVGKDEAEAVNWYRKAAEQGYALAREALKELQVK